MSRRSPSDIRNFDWMTLMLYIGLVSIGWLMIYAVGYQEEAPPSVFDLNPESGKQLIWVFIAFFAFFITYLIDWKFWRTFSYPIYVLALLLLVLVLFFGITVKGATS